MPAVGQFNPPDDRVDAPAYAVIGAAIEVHRILGPGLLESAYEEALAAELGLRKVPYERQVAVDVLYKGLTVGQGRLDLLVAGERNVPILRHGISRVVLSRP